MKIIKLTHKVEFEGQSYEVLEFPSYLKVGQSIKFQKAQKIKEHEDRGVHMIAALLNKPVEFIDEIPHDNWEEIQEEALKFMKELKSPGKKNQPRREKRRNHPKKNRRPAAS
jgi:hypothetical protein